MRRASICGFLLLLVVIFRDARANSASLNTATLLFGSVFPSSLAAPESCISITASAELLFEAGNISKESSGAQWSASTHACPPAANSSGVPYVLVFESLHAGNSSSSHQLAIKIHAIQKASSSYKDMELRWSRTVSLDFSAGSAAENLDLDLQLAKLYSTTKHAKQPPPKPSEDLLLVSETSAISENTACVPLSEENDFPSYSKKPSAAAQQGLIALFCLVAGILTGRAFSAKLSQRTSPYQKKQTCEVACSPFVVEKVVKGGASGRSKNKWVRDNDGRLLKREDIIKGAEDAVAAAADSGLSLLGTSFSAQEEKYNLEE